MSTLIMSAIGRFIFMNRSDWRMNNELIDYLQKIESYIRVTGAVKGNFYKLSRMPSAIGNNKAMKQSVVWRFSANLIRAVGYTVGNTL